MSSDKTGRVADTTPSRRQRQADQTRADIVQAARRLFAGKGYRATTVRDVAVEAGVSVQTVYDSVGSKRALVLELNNQLDAEAGIAQIARGAATEEDPGALLAVPTRVTRALLDHCGDIIRAVIAAAAEEPEMAQVVMEGHRRHAGGTAMVVDRLAAVGALRPDADLRALKDTVAVITDSATGILLMDQYGWSTQRVERWMLATLTATVPWR
jgi:AcrR family transcriptional regulator